MKFKVLFLIVFHIIATTQVKGQQESLAQLQKIAPISVIPLSVIPLKDRLKLKSRNRQHPIILGNDSNGLFYFNYISGDTLMFKRHSETSSQNFALNLKDFDLNNGLQHCIIKDKNCIILKKSK